MAICNSDPFHHRAFSELLVGLGYNGGVPITREFGVAHMDGRSNEQIGRFLFPDWDQDAFFRDKEALFARYAREGLEQIAGLCRWAQDRGLKRAAVTNAELMVGILGLSDFFQLIVTGEDCDRSKPFPDPYLRALALLGASPDHTVVFEDSTIRVQAGVPVVAIADERRESKLLAVGATLVIRDYQDPKLWAALDKKLKPKQEPPLRSMDSYRIRMTAENKFDIYIFQICMLRSYRISSR
jgi:beta-phosphoglucomutase-like phosphatase (HAD superfamily)